MEEEKNENNITDVDNALIDNQYPSEQGSSRKIDNRKVHSRKCPYCKQEYQTKIGIDNWKNLFRKPTIDDWIVLVILVLLLGAAFAYTTETKACRETLQNLDQVCMKRASVVNYTGNGVPVYTLPTNITIENETETDTGIISNENTTIGNDTVAVTGTSVEVNVTVDNSIKNSSNASG